MVNSNPTPVLCQRLYMNLLNPPRDPLGQAAIIIITILKTRKLRHRDVKYLPKVTQLVSRNRDSNPGRPLLSLCS